MHPNQSSLTQSPTNQPNPTQPNQNPTAPGADAVVLPTRGEGWGRPQMEAMAMSRPLITTNWSGPTAYITEGNAYPLAIEGLAAAAKGEGRGPCLHRGLPSKACLPVLLRLPVFSHPPTATTATTAHPPDMNATDPDCPAGWNPWFDGQQWARPSVSHLRALMRRVVARPGEAAAKGRAARADVLARFTPEVLAARVRAEVARIQRKLASDASVPRALTSPRSATRARQTARGLPAAGGGMIATIPQIGSSGGGGGGGGAPTSWQEYKALSDAARAHGFSGAGGGGEAALDTTWMRLGEVLDALEGRGPRTTMTGPGRGGHDPANANALAPWSGGGGAGAVNGLGVAGWEGPGGRGGIRAPVVEEEEVEDGEDDSIVLNR
jgi:hypothetical protein